MNVLILGNGFDINYKLPTKYIDFLHTVKYISDIPLSQIETVGDIFGSEELQKVDNGIAESYQTYQVIYDSVKLEESEISKLSELARQNIWFSYLYDSLNKDIGWIDFEREVATVLDSFRKFLPKLRVTFSGKDIPEDPIDRHILSTFVFFYTKKHDAQRTLTGRPVDSEFLINKQYVMEYPIGSRNIVINKEKIVRILGKQLQELADGLRIYLKCFVENPVIQMCKGKMLQPMLALSNAQHIVTFNYTNTYELVYNMGETFHIHGNIKDRIVLGVNADDADKIETIDTLFLPFKKYYQRVINHSDSGYLDWIYQKHQDIHLTVMGHSLDITDRDVIMQMFDLAKDITILYFDENTEASLAVNLVRMYGKEKFDKLRLEKRLRFLPQNESYADFAENRQLLEEEARMRTFSF